MAQATKSPKEIQSMKNFGSHDLRNRCSEGTEASQELLTKKEDEVPKHLSPHKLSVGGGPVLGSSDWGPALSTVRNISVQHTC